MPPVSSADLIEYQYLLMGPVFTFLKEMNMLLRKIQKEMNMLLRKKNCARLFS